MRVSEKRVHPNNLRVVGLDQSYTGFGYCVMGEAKKNAFPADRYSSEGSRLLAIEGWLEDWLLSVEPIDLVVREGYANAAKYGREAAGELGWAVNRTVFNVTGEWPLVVPPNSLKKFVSGSGASKKNTMLMHVYRQWGEQFSDDNQADAYSLEKFGIAYLLHNRPGQTQTYHKYQIEAVEAVKAKL